MSWLAAIIAALQNGFIDLINQYLLRRQKEEENQKVEDEVLNAKSKNEAQKAIDDIARGINK